MTWRGNRLAILASAATVFCSADRVALSDAQNDRKGGPSAAPAESEKTTPGAALALRDGFEGAAVAGFWLPGDYGSGLHVPGAVALTKEHARTGVRSVRITVKEGDVPQPGSDGTPTERAELDSGHFPLVGRDAWYGFSFLIPVGFPVVDDRLVLSSCKQTDLGDPLVAQRYRKGRHFLTVRDPRQPEGKRTFALPALRQGKWVDMVYHVRYSPREDGRVEVWMDGARVVSHTGPLTDPGGKNRFYHKIGLYRDRWKEPMTAYFDNYTLGDSFAAVDPSRFPPGR